MVMTSKLRAQAAEFQPQTEQSTDGIPSGSNTAVPTPTCTPAPDTAVVHETAQQLADRIAADNRGSFSTLSESTAADHDDPTTDNTAPPNEKLQQLEKTTSSHDMIKNIRQMVDDDDEVKPTTSPVAVGRTYTTNPSAAENTFKVPASQYQSVIPGLSTYAYTYGYNYVYPNSVSHSYPTQSYYTIPYTTNNTAQLVNPQGQTILSAGSDPISEGRRIYIGNLKYSVNRAQIKKLLRQYGVYHTVEKIYMPYGDPVINSSTSASGGPGLSSSMSDTPTAATFPNNIPLDHRNGDDSQRGDGDLPNKGYVFVTFGDAFEAEQAIKRISGVMHFERRLVCRPGLPKGVAFRQADVGSGPGFYRGGKRRHEKKYWGDRFRDYNDERPRGDDAYYASRDYTFASQGGSLGVDYVYDGGYASNGYTGGKARYSMDSGYRSAAPSLWRGSFGQDYGSVNGLYH
ncbi:hypothetical protein SCAR479_09810 [Seiridium cardinale]|uniref:RRM domain-containing protein n=1 Tax=Seiridium cardinale TaxID=138064 RepID=A0ABR2XI45_9PEZI